jgi:hypothetical protein
MAAPDLDELGQEGEEEQRRLRVEQVDDEAFAKQPRMAAGLEGDVDVRMVLAAEYLAQPDPDQIGRARLFDDREGVGRGGQLRRKAERSRRDMHQRR